MVIFSNTNIHQFSPLFPYHLHYFYINKLVFIKHIFSNTHIHLSYATTGLCIVHFNINKTQISLPTVTQFSLLQDFYMVFKFITKFLQIYVELLPTDLSQNIQCMYA